MHHITKNHRTYCDRCRKYRKIGFLHNINDNYLCDNCFIASSDKLKNLIIDFKTLKCD